MDHKFLFLFAKQLKHYFSVLLKSRKGICEKKKLNIEKIIEKTNLEFIKACLILDMPEKTCSDIEFDTSGSLYKNKHGYHLFTYRFADYSFGHLCHLNQM